MGNELRSAVFALIAALTAVMLGCTERADLAPVLTGHQGINDAFSDAPNPYPYPPPVTRGHVPPLTKRQEIPPVPRDAYPGASGLGHHETIPPTRPRNAVKADARNKEKSGPKTIASNLTAKKSIMAKVEQANLIRNVPATDIKSTASRAKKANAKLSFGWPLAGSISQNYAQTGKKGIKISGKTGQTVHAAEAGKVVYSGKGLIGYGNLLIIRHNRQYLTAYANNSDLLAKEGDVVEKGQGIATVGANASHKGILHFEIRKQGKSVNPLTLLPKP